MPSVFLILLLQMPNYKGITTFHLYPKIMRACIFWIRMITKYLSHVSRFMFSSYCIFNKFCLHSVHWTIWETAVNTVISNFAFNLILASELK
jgi:hypothetical protein